MRPLVDDSIGSKVARDDAGDSPEWCRPGCCPRSPVVEREVVILARTMGGIWYFTLVVTPPPPLVFFVLLPSKGHERVCDRVRRLDRLLGLYGPGRPEANGWAVRPRGGIQAKCVRSPCQGLLRPTRNGGWRWRWTAEPRSCGQLPRRVPCSWNNSSKGEPIITRVGHEVGYQAHSPGNLCKECPPTSARSDDSPCVAPSKFGDETL